jgi:hypothetical protein
LSADAEMVIRLVQGASRSLAAEIEEAISGDGTWWTDELRATVAKRLEARIGSEVAEIVEALVFALRTAAGGDGS